MTRQSNLQVRNNNPMLPTTKVNKKKKKKKSCVCESMSLLPLLPIDVKRIK